MRFLLAFLLVPSLALAADFPLLAGDTPLTREEVVAMTRSDILEFYEGGQSRYAADGAYSYTYRTGGTAHGRFDIDDTGLICIAFDNGRARCDRFVHSHGRLVMITESGDRYPVRP